MGGPYLNTFASAALAAGHPRKSLTCHQSQKLHLINFCAIKTHEVELLPNHCSTRAGASFWFQLHPLTGSFRRTIHPICPLLPHIEIVAVSFWCCPNQRAEKLAHSLLFLRLAKPTCLAPSFRAMFSLSPFSKLFESTSDNLALFLSLYNLSLPPHVFSMWCQARSAIR